MQPRTTPSAFWSFAPFAQLLYKQLERQSGAMGLEEGAGGFEELGFEAFDIDLQLVWRHIVLRADVLERVEVDLKFFVIGVLLGTGVGGRALTNDLRDFPCRNL